MKTVAIIKYVFSVLGIGMLIGAFFLHQNTQDFLQTALYAEGKVVKLLSSRSTDSITYKPVVEFRTEEGEVVKFTSSSGSNPPSYTQGEIVEVLYQPLTPQDARINGFFALWGGATILAGLGLSFFLIGFSIVLLGILSAKRISFLKSHGMPVKAQFQGVEINNSLKVNGRSPYVIRSQWLNPKTSELHVFTSENIWFDPSEHISVDELTVLIEKDNPKSYYVDISFLPKLAD